MERDRISYMWLFYISRVKKLLFGMIFIIVANLLTNIIPFRGQFSIEGNIFVLSLPGN